MSQGRIFGQLTAEEHDEEKRLWALREDLTARINACDVLHDAWFKDVRERLGIDPDLYPAFTVLDDGTVTEPPHEHSHAPDVVSSQA